MTKTAPELIVADLIERTLVHSESDNRRTDAFAVIEHLINGADRLARAVMDTDEINTFTVNLDAALAVLDDMD